MYLWTRNPNLFKERTIKIKLNQKIERKGINEFTYFWYVFESQT